MSYTKSCVPRLQNVCCFAFCSRRHIGWKISPKQPNIFYKFYLQKCQFARQLMWDNLKNHLCCTIHHNSTHLNRVLFFSNTIRVPYCHKRNPSLTRIKIFVVAELPEAACARVCNFTHGSLRERPCLPETDNSTVCCFKNIH